MLLLVEGMFVAFDLTIQPACVVYLCPNLIFTAPILDSLYRNENSLVMVSGLATILQESVLKNN